MEQANTNEEKVNHVNSELRLIAASREEMEAEARLIKSRERVQKHGEVFTPLWMVRLMLSNPPIQEKLRDVHTTFLEPAAGEGAFLTEILRQKLEHINADTQHTRGANWKYQTLWALMSIYGIELLEAAGYEFEDGVLAASNPIQLEYLTNTTSGHIAIAESIQQDLAAVGIELSIAQQDWNVFLEERKQGNFDFAREGWIADFNDPINMLEMWTTVSGNNDCQFGR